MFFFVPVGCFLRHKRKLCGPERGDNPQSILLRNNYLDVPCLVNMQGYVRMFMCVRVFVSMTPRVHCLRFASSGTNESGSNATLVLPAIRVVTM